MYKLKNTHYHDRIFTNLFKAKTNIIESEK